MEWCWADLKFERVLIHRTAIQYHHCETYTNCTHTVQHIQNRLIYTTVPKYKRKRRENEEKSVLYSIDRLTDIYIHRETRKVREKKWKTPKREQIEKSNYSKTHTTVCGTFAWETLRRERIYFTTCCYFIYIYIHLCIFSAECCCLFRASATNLSALSLWITSASVYESVSEWVDVVNVCVCLCTSVSYICVVVVC